LGKDIDLPLVIHIGTTNNHRAHNITWHYHQGTEVIFLLSGAVGYEFREHEPVHVHGGHFLMIPRGVEHRGIQNVRTPAILCGVVLNPNFCDAWPSAGSSSPLAKGELHWMRNSLARSGPVVCSFSRDLKGVLERLMKAQREFEGNRQSHLFRASLRLWACAVIVGAVGELSAPSSPVSHELVVAAQEYLKQHLAEPVRMPDLVKHIGLGQSQLFHLFKVATGLTPNDYLVRLRVEKAKELLARPRQSVTDVALEAGFSSAQYFSGVFRKYSGQTPREYREAVCWRTDT
jgi:AraC-like DNA-binding protein